MEAPLARRTGASEWFAKHDIAVHFGLAADDWLEDRVACAAVKFLGGTSTTVWHLPFSSQRWRFPGPATPLLIIPGFAEHLRVGRSSSGRAFLLFNTVARTAHLWRLAIDRNLGTPSGPLGQLTDDISLLKGLEGTRARVSS